MELDLKTAIPVVEKDDGMVDTDTSLELQTALPLDLASATKTWAIMSGDKSPQDIFDKGLATAKTRFADLREALPESFDMVFTKPVKDIFRAEAVVVFPQIAFLDFVKGVLGAGDIKVNKWTDAFTKFPLMAGVKSAVTGEAPNMAESLVKNFHITNPHVADIMAGAATAVEWETYFGALSTIGEVAPKTVNALRTSYYQATTSLKNRVLDSVREGYRFQNPGWSEGQVETQSLNFFRKLSGEGVDGFKVNTENPFSLMRSVNNVRKGFGLETVTPQILYSDLTGMGAIFNSKEIEFARQIVAGAKLSLPKETMAKLAPLGLEGIEAAKHILSASKLSPNTAKGGEIENSLWHETGSYGLESLMAYSDATGLNVSTNKDFALGQGGKGILVELNKEKLLGDRGSLAPIKKPGTPIAGQNEFRLVGGNNAPGTIKSITIKEGTPVSKVQKAILNRDYNKVVNEDKSITFTPKLSPKEVAKGGEIEVVGKDENVPVIEDLKGEQGKERGFTASVKEEMPVLNVAGQYIPRSTDELAIKARTLIKEDLATAQEMAAKGTDDASVATGAELLKYYVNEAEGASGLAKDAIYDKATELANSMAERLTELGRSVQAASILARLTPEGQVRFAARTIQKYNEGLKDLKKRIPELTPEQTKDILERMKEIQGMSEGEGKAIKFKELQDMISDLVPTPLMDKIITVWKAGLLTGLKTTGVNILANVSHAVSEMAKDLPATIVDIIASNITGERTVVFTPQGYLKGSKEGADKGWRFLKTGYDERNVLSKLDYKRVNMGESKITKGIQAYEEFVFKVLGAEDQPFYYGAKMRSLYEQAKVEAINKGLKGKEAQDFIDNLVMNPTDDMVLLAVNDAQIAVFQNETALGKLAKAIQNLPTGAAEFILPFGRTPSAVATQIINYSPVGAVKTLIQNWGENFNQRDFSKGLGRAITGTGILGLGAWLYNQGMVNLDRPKSEAELKRWELEGRTPNTIKVGGAYRQVQVLGPLGNVLLVGAHFAKAYQDTGSIAGTLAQGAFGAIKTFNEQTFLQGVNSALEAWSDPQRSAATFVNSFVGSWVPTIVKDVAVGTDIKARRAESPIQKIIERMPILRQMLEPQVDVFGKDIERTNNFIETMIDPTRPSKIKNDPIVNELRRLTTAKQDINTSQLGKRTGYKSLSQKQNTEMWRQSGQVAYEKISQLMQYDAYNAMPDERKTQRINKIIDEAKETAKLGAIIERTKDIDGDQLTIILRVMKKEGLLTEGLFKKYMRIR